MTLKARLSSCHDIGAVCVRTHVAACSVVQCSSHYSTAHKLNEMLIEQCISTVIADNDEVLQALL